MRQIPTRTIGKLLPTYVDQDAVRAQKARLNPFFVTTDRTVQACAQLPPEEKAAWNAFYQSWEAYRTAPESWWTASAEYDAGLVFEKTLQSWQTTIGGRCHLPGPVVVTNEDTAPDLSPIKWAAAAVVVVAVVYGVRTVLK